MRYVAFLKKRLPDLARMKSETPLSLYRSEKGEHHE